MKQQIIRWRTRDMMHVSHFINDDRMCCLLVYIWHPFLPPLCQMTMFASLSSVSLLSRELQDTTITCTPSLIKHGKWFYSYSSFDPSSTFSVSWDTGFCFVVFQKHQFGTFHRCTGSFVTHDSIKMFF